MKQIWKQWSIKNGSGVATRIVEINKKKVKCIYEVGNAYERFTIEVFDGYKFNNIGSIWSIGGRPDSSTYIYEESKILSRYNDLQKNADSYIKTLLS